MSVTDLQKLALPFRKSAWWRDIISATAERISVRFPEIAPEDAVRLALELARAMERTPAAVQGTAQRILERHATTIAPAIAVGMAHALVYANASRLAAQILERHGTSIPLEEILRIDKAFALVANALPERVQSSVADLLVRHAGAITPDRALQIVLGLMAASQNALTDPLDLALTEEDDAEAPLK